MIQESVVAGREIVQSDRVSARFEGCVVVSGGDFLYHRRLEGCVVFADGMIQTEQRTYGCLLIARGGVDVEESAYRRRTIPPGEAWILDEQSLGIVASPTKRPLGLVRFFEVADVGLTLDACKVTKVIGPLAKAGVQSGDMFTHVDGVAVKDAEALRKALRRRYAILGYGAFTLTRDGKPLTVVAELGE
jgi:hypothetical protein